MRFLCAVTGHIRRINLIATITLNPSARNGIHVHHLVHRQRTPYFSTDFHLGFITKKFNYSEQQLGELIHSSCVFFCKIVNFCTTIG